MKYIFVAGAPGSKWSSVAKNIYQSKDIDHSDESLARIYAHSGAYSGQPMHQGSYFDPGMEFGNWFDCIDQYSKQECVAEFDLPFTDSGVRIIKSHAFCNHVKFLRETWPNCPVVTVLRSNDACLGWWVRCGGFDISYPNYNPYYRNISTMVNQIAQQNKNLIAVLNDFTSRTVYNNHQLCAILNITTPLDPYLHDYTAADIDVRVLN